MANAETTLKLSRPLKVFHKDRLLRPLEGTEVEDSFYEFTEEDFYRVIKGKGTEPAFKTRAIREQEEKERIDKLGPVRIRYIFPDGIICETEFSAVDTIGDVQAFLRELIQPEQMNSVQFFITPPKKCLTDLSLSLFHAKLVPAANLFVEIESNTTTEATPLKEEILALKQDDEEETVSTVTRLEQLPSISITEQEKRSSASSGTISDGQKKAVPKWFRM